MLMSDLLIKTESLYAALLDEASPANLPGFMSKELARARQRAGALGLVKGEELFLFNDSLIKRSDRGELLPWTLLFDGVFRAQVQMDTPLVPPASALRSKKSLGAPFQQADLHCRTGRLLLLCMSQVGQRNTPILDIEPGVYRAELTCDDDEQAKHWFLDDPADYPAGDGPDWWISLRRVDALYGPAA